MVDVFSTIFKEAINQSQVTLVHPMIPEIVALKELVPIPKNNVTKSNKKRSSVDKSHYKLDF